MVFSFTFQVFWMKIHSKLNRFRIKKLYWHIVSDFRFLLGIQAILPKNSLFLSAQMVFKYLQYMECITLGKWQKYLFKLKNFPRLLIELYYGSFKNQNLIGWTCRKLESWKTWDDFRLTFWMFYNFIALHCASTKGLQKRGYIYIL